MIKRDNTTRNRDEEDREIAKICLNCPYNTCVENIYKGASSSGKCDYFRQEFKKLQTKYGSRRIGHYDK